MTPAQFEALAQLLRLRAGPAQQAAALHLVDGLTIPDAARQVGMAYKDAYDAIKRINAGADLARKAVM